MKRTYTRYSKELLEQVVPGCNSYTEVLRRLNKKPVGGSITNLRLMCYRWSIDTSHMTGSAHGKGKHAKNRLSADKRLVVGTPFDHRVSADKLRRALDDIGVPYKCSECRRQSWRGKPLVLEVDHIDGQYWNNSKENLRYLCPNCHSQIGKVYGQDLLSKQTFLEGKE